MPKRDTFFTQKHCDRCGGSLDGGRIMSMYNEDCLCMKCKDAEIKREDYRETCRKDMEAYMERAKSGRDLSANAGVKYYQLTFNNQVAAYRFKLITPNGGERVYDMGTDVFEMCSAEFQFGKPAGVLPLIKHGNVWATQDEISKRVRITELMTVGEFKMVLSKCKLI